MANKIVLKKSSVAAKVPLSTDLEVGEIAVNLVDQKLYSKKSDGTVVLVGNSTLGDVTGAASSTDNAVVRFDGTTGKVIQNSSVTIDDSNNVSGVATLNAANIVIADNATLGSSNSDSVAVNGRITTDLEPNTTGSHDIGTSGRNWRDGFFSRNLAAATLNATDVNANSAIISANTSTNALRITQVGTGNALMVEDSANPDATPFVVSNDGSVFKGYTSSIPVEFNLGFQINGTGADSSASLTRWAANTGSPILGIAKSRGATIATRGVVQSGDSLGTLNFYGDDGTNFITSARVDAAVDGTPGTNDMPGRLVFSTTADGASSPTERMRIANNGSVMIGGVGGGEVGLGFYGAGTSNAGVAGTIRSFRSVPSGATTFAVGFENNLVTQAASFTLPNYYGFLAQQNTIGAGSTVTNQFGFYAQNNLTGATNNYGFYSNIASGTGRYNFYAAGSAANYMAGNVGIGTTNPGTGTKLNVSGRGLFTGGVTDPFDGTASGVSISYDTANNIGHIAAVQTGVATRELRITSAEQKFIIGSTERMRISSGGIISLGAAPGAESLRVTPVGSAVNYVQIGGAGTGVSPVIRFQGSDANVGGFYDTTGSGSHFFRTNVYGGAPTQFLIAHTASAVNYLQVSGAVTGGGPFILSQGSDANINVLIATKGTGAILFRSDNGANDQFRVAHTASAVNYLQVTGGATGSAATLSAQGSDTNIDIALTPKGTGVLRFGTYTAGILAQAGYIQIKDAAGNVRNLLVG
jgi:hypothetical protein